MPTTQNHDLPAYDHRPGAAPTLVFLHYWGGSARTWQAVVDRLPDRDVLTIDARGWSRSKGLPGPYTLRQLVDDTLAVIADASVQEFVLVGHSMGGKVAQLVAARRPTGLRGLVLVGPAPARPGAEVTPGYQEQLSRAYDSVESTRMALEHVLTASALPADMREQVVVDSLASSPGARVEWPQHGIVEDITAQTRQIAAPVVVVGGEHDQVEPVAGLRHNLMPYLAQARVEVVAGSGHLLPLEAPDEVAHMVAAFSRGA